MSATGRPLPTLRPAPPAPGRGARPEAAGATPWRPAHLLRAPHRLAFFLAMALLLASGLWWAAVQVDRATGALGLSYAVSPTVLHAAVMSFGFMPLFFAGFLFTAGPKWLGLDGPGARTLRPMLLLQALGWLLWLAGGHGSQALAVAGAGAAAAGLAWQYGRLGALVRTSRAPDRLHARVVTAAGAFGALSVAGLALATAFGAVDLARAFVLSGLWGFPVLTYIAVAHRMIPFFTSSAVPMVQVWRPFWVLWALLGAALLECLAVWLDWAGLAGGRPGMGVRGLLELAAGAVVLWLGVAWGLVQSLRIRLLAMLHLGFLWLGLSFVLAGTSQWLGLAGGAPLFGLGALHALTMGFLGSILLAMVTRVSCGHSGRALVADGLVWGLFWSLQAAVLLRLAGAVPLASSLWLLAAALLWALTVLVWGLRLMNWYGRPRADGRPG